MYLLKRFIKIELTLIFFVFTYTLFSNDKLHLITVATKNTHNLEILKHSAKVNGIELTVLGMKEKWVSYGTKFIILNRYLQNLSDEDIVLFVDAYDVVVLGNKEEFISAYKQKNVPIICAAETVLWPAQLKFLSKIYPPSNTRFRYLNSGSYIGRVKFLKKMFQDMHIDLTNGVFDDQAYMNVFFLNHQDIIFLDREIELFLPLHLVSPHHLKYDLHNRRIFLKETKTCPLLAHGNGPQAKLLYKNLNKLLFHQKNIFNVSLEYFDFNEYKMY